MKIPESGKRVKVTKEGHYRVRYRNPHREGVIVGTGYGGTCWRVLWDGNRVPEAIHKSCIAIIEN